MTRERALTESSYASGSTATPPKLLETDLDLGQSDLDELGTMFESFGKRRSQSMAGQESTDTELTASPVSLVENVLASSPDRFDQDNMSPHGSRLLTKSYYGERPSKSPPPARSDRSRKAESSSYSRSSHGSQDGLMHTTSPTLAERTPDSSETFSIPKHGRISVLPRQSTLPGSDSPSQQSRTPRPPSGSGAGLRRSVVYPSPRDSDLLHDEDAKLVMDSLNASRKMNRQSGGLGMLGNQIEDVGQLPSSSNVSAHSQPLLKDMSFPTPSSFADRHVSSVAMFDSNEQEFQNLGFGSSETTPRARQRPTAHLPDHSSFDASEFSSTKLPPPLYGNTSSTAPSGQHKVMTPDQFNRYKKEQERAMTNGHGSISGGSDDENENYDDDDEVERNRQIAKQRRKQEAHLAVYRQQMMKMTGEQPSDLPSIGQFRTGTDKASYSTGDLPGTMATPTFNLDSAPRQGQAGDEEDEDIPLGILAAHGFPSKNRPPSMFSNVGTNPYIRYNSESYPAPSIPSTGVSNTGTAKGLPPFARNLPADPYFGAGLVNPSNRQSLAFGASTGGPGHGNHAPNVQPPGLINVIANEERARAMRRGSPNAQGNYGSPLPHGLTQGQMGMTPNMPFMPPNDGAQAQMSHQMNQMMQMQMQWMQQMQQMVAGSMQGPGSIQQPPAVPPHQQQMINTGFLSPPGQTSRPMSMGSSSAPTTPGPNQPFQQRAMSMLGPGAGSQWVSRGNIRLTAPSVMSGALGDQGYAPSIAPSERSNIGMPSRYRPVSIAPNGDMPPTIPEPFQVGGDRRSLFSVALQPPPPTKKQSVTPSDDDDDEGWEEMKKNREKKKSYWRFRKGDTQGLQET